VAQTAHARPAILILVVLLSSCDRTDQRIWNCSAEKIDFFIASAPDFATVETIPGRSWISFNKGRSPITSISVADGTHAKVVWQRGQPTANKRFNSEDEVCAGKTAGVVVQQF
jgi:hypothetical protein